MRGRVGGDTGTRSRSGRAVNVALPKLSVFCDDVGLLGSNALT